MSILPDYKPELFVDREADIPRVVDLARVLATGRAVPRRTVIFRGERGSGKTWLLRHLAKDAYASEGSSPDATGGQLAAVSGIKSWYMSLATVASAAPEEAVKAVMRALREQIGTWRGVPPQFSAVGNLTPYELSNLVAHDVNKLVQKFVMVLLLDHVYESPSPFLEALEDRLMAPLAVERKVLIVMAGRGQGYAWKSPELRIHVDECWLQGLGVPAALQPVSPSTRVAGTPVDPEQLAATQAQVNKLEQEGYTIEWGPDDILPKTQGHPSSSFLLATGRSDGEVVTILLEGVFPEQLEKQGRQILELICVLRFFDEPQIQGMLSACKNDSEFQNVVVLQPREIIGKLLQAKLVRWDTTLKNYVLDQVIRRPLEGDLERRQRDLWQRLHEAGWAMYCHWVEEYPQDKERLEREAEYHAARLGILDQEKGACPEMQAHEES